MNRRDRDDSGGLRRTLFCFLTGNEDMHLKNFSLLVEPPRVRLAPAYDMVNTTLALPRTTEETALPIRGKRRKLSREDLLDYFAKERLGIEPRAVEDVLKSIAGAFPDWDRLIGRSFLPEGLRSAYRGILKSRRERLGT